MQLTYVHLVCVTLPFIGLLFFILWVLYLILEQLQIINRWLHNMDDLEGLVYAEHVSCEEDKDGRKYE